MMLPSLVLIAVFSQPAPTVALTIDGQTRIVSVVEAERLLDSSDTRLHAAAAIALGTRATEPELVTLPRHDIERERWQRQPAQKPIPDN